MNAEEGVYVVALNKMWTVEETIFLMARNSYKLRGADIIPFLL